MNNTKKTLIFFGAQGILLMISELIARSATIGFSFGDASGKIISLMTALCYAAILAFLESLFSLRVGKITAIIFQAVTCLFYAAQIASYKAYGRFFSSYTLSNFGKLDLDASVLFGGVMHALVPILIIVVLAGVTIYGLFKVEGNKVSWGISDRQDRKDALLIGTNPKATIIIVGILAITIVSSALLASNSRMRYGSPKFSAKKSQDTTALYSSFGICGGFVIDETRRVFGFIPQIDEITSGEEAVREYLSEPNFSKENDYTGLFEDYNVIVINAQNFTDLAISSVYTPTLYKLATEGIQIDNYYVPTYDVPDINNEYALLTSLLPTGGTWSLKKTSGNAYPYTLHSLLEADGYRTQAFTNKLVKLYGRNRAFTNLGLEFDGVGKTLHIKDATPTSDVELTEKTVDKFTIRNDNGYIQAFYTYYITSSGGGVYRFDDNDMAMKHEAQVGDMPLCEGARAYMAANMEFDLGVEKLMSMLDNESALHRTIIVITTSRTPSELTDDEFCELYGYSKGIRNEDTCLAVGRAALENDERLRDRGSLIIWTSDMESKKFEKIQTGKVCSPLDIIPTVINLLGYKYNTNRYMGSDILADGEGIAVFKDYSWITDKGTREEYDVGGMQAASYLAKIDEKVQKMFDYSMLIQKYNAYKTVKVE